MNDKDEEEDKGVSSSMILTLEKASYPMSAKTKDVALLKQVTWPWNDVEGFVSYGKLCLHDWTCFLVSYFL